MRSRTVAAAVLLLVAVGVAVMLVWPQALGAQRVVGVAQLIAFRAPLALGLAVVAAVTGAVVLLMRRRAVRLRRMLVAFTAVVALAAGGNAAVLFARGTAAGGTRGLGNGDLTVLVWNTQGGATSPAEVAELVLSTGAEVVSLPEMDDDAAAEVARRATAGGIPMTAATTRAVAETSEPSWIPTSLLVADRRGAYRLDASAGTTRGLPSGVWRPVDGSGPVIVAAHPAAPLTDGMDDWRAGLDWVRAQCQGIGPELILAGDLNATVDHLDVGDCRDAATEAHAAATGTWPATMPAWLAASIDHVLVGSAWHVREVRVVDATGGTDHRALVAVLVRHD
ncbi:endonuclease/exonuclease/phosphatase family protein [Microbacterium sp. Au-Mic1]|uniref:endonuclease/exonuclease/phosphatase family protein n=1 Tax=Microbacterium sp. Au-Mic1 TaxID=2906457 RepID=UPI001E3AE1F5|nr:endonuclease/exonuclease/phosphatase family protein [Microbacterium sp. Au-Mic1]MCE4026141.1 endonuclease/exonuclease/phosphatase family protein [Microbacterium sp. Au-Mic1]